MRVFCLSTWFPYPPDNGAKIRAYHLLRAMGSAHQVTLVALQSVGAEQGRPGLASDLGVAHVRAVPVDPFRYVGMHQALKFCSPIPLAYWPSKLVRQAVAENARSGPWDAVVSIETHVARYASQLPAVPCILDVDTSLSYQMRERYLGQQGRMSQWRAWVSWLKAYHYERRLFRKFQACTVVAAAELDHVRTMVKGSWCQVELNPNGVDCGHNRPGLAVPRTNHLVFNGTLTYSANYDAMQYFLAAIYPQIQAQVPDVSLTITGSTAGVDLSRLQLDESVLLSGYVDDVRPLVTGAWVCVVPLRQGGGTRIKILEAMALGTPVVATSKGAEGLEVTPEQDILVADEPTEFAALVVRLLHDSSLRERLSANARRLVEGQYDWREIGRRFVDLIEQAVAGYVPVKRDR